MAMTEHLKRHIITEKGRRRVMDNAGQSAELELVLLTLLAHAPQTTQALLMALRINNQKLQELLRTATDAGFVTFEYREDLQQAPRGTSLRQVFREEYMGLPTQERVALAMKSDSHALLPLCFDQAELVLTAIVDNPNYQRHHAQLIAANCRSRQGLLLLLSKQTWLNDPKLLASLLKNPAAPKKLIQSVPKLSRPLEIWRLLSRRDMVSHHAITLQGMLNDAFTNMTAPFQEQLLVQTRGRVVRLLTDVEPSSFLRQRIARNDKIPSDTMTYIERWLSPQN